MRDRPTLAHIPEGCQVSVLHLHSIVVSEAVWVSSCSPQSCPTVTHAQLQVIKLEEHKKDGTSMIFLVEKRTLQAIFDNERS